MNLVKSSPTVHDKFGPSTHPMLAICPALVQSKEENYHMRRGTFMHDLVYNLHVGNITVEEVLEEDITSLFSEEFTAEDRLMVVKAYDHLKMSIEWFGRQMQTDYVICIPEKFVELPNLGIKGGTCDMILLADFKHVLAIDYKFGWTYVPPESEQIMSYLTGLARTYPGGRVFGGVIQPAIHDEPLIRETTHRLIQQHEEQMKLIIRSADSGCAPCVPNRYCGQRCVKFATCPAARASLNLAETVEYDLDSMPIELLSDLAYKAIKLKGLAGTFEQALVRRLMAGETDERFYMAEGAERRIWIDESLAEVVLKRCIQVKNANLRKGQKPASEDKIFKPREIISITEAEKLVGKSAAVRAVFNQATIKKKGAATLKQKFIAIGERGESNV